MACDVLTIASGECSVGVIPERGGLVSDLTVAGKQVLYLDSTTVNDATKSVRGGIPILFPFAGKLVDDRFLHSGTIIRQHGFARDKKWAIARSDRDEIEIVLHPDAETLRSLPFEFVAKQTITAVPRGIYIELSVANRGSQPMPLSPGWHPYFLCPATRKSSVTTDLNEHPEDLFKNDDEFDFGLPAPKTGRVALELPETGIVSLSFSPEMRHLQFWSQPGKDFVCVEPYVGPANAINTPLRSTVEPGRCSSFWLRLQCTEQDEHM